MDPSFSIDAERSEQLPTVEEARMNAEMQSRRQSNASLSKGSDIETAYSGSVGTADHDHDQLPTVEDIRMNNPGASHGGRCKVFLLAAFLVVAVVIVTVALVLTQAGTEGDEFNMATGGSYENNNGIPTTTTFTPQDEATTQVTTDAPKPETPSTPAAPTTLHPSALGRYGKILDILSQNGISSMEGMSVQGSHQQRAAEWIAEKDEHAVSLDDTAAIIQRYILTVFFYAMGGEQWTNKLNFLSKEEECKWYVAGFAGDNKQLKQFGITCNGDGKVKAIHFPSNFLVGAFPMELNKLTDLERLDVFSNGRITGGFPDFLNGMTKLNYLGLHYCGIQGQLPSWLGSLTALKSLVLSNNQFSGALPASMSQLTNLENLYLDDNVLNGGIGVLRGLSKLQTVILEDNQFEGALDDAMVSGWPNLQVFDASHNKLKSTIPGSLFNLNNLRILDLHENEFYGSLPKIAGTRPNLQMLTLNENNLVGEIPTNLSLCINLKTLDLSGNQFTATIPAAIGNLAKMEYLFLAQNSFDAGEIPPSFSNLVALKQLSLKDTKRTGPIPGWIGNLKQLILLDLDMNSLSGPIPPILSNLHQLQYLLLNRNELEGTIPATLSVLENLKFFMIDQNKLSGSAEAVCQKPDNVEMFIADCQGESPEVDCPCCNVCCSDGNAQCNDKVWLGDSNPIWELGFERPGVELDADASRSYTVTFTGEIYDGASP